jgi:ABC-type uncharacterized transport system involved in gliding motility auxiliary subunit
MPRALGGGQRPIYFAPLIEKQTINHELDFMQNINRLVAVRISPLELKADLVENNGIAAQRVFSSSAQAWEMKGRIVLNPEMIRPPQSEDEFQSFPLAYLLAGAFPSYFTGKPLPEAKPAATATKDEPDAAPVDDEAAGDGPKGDPNDDAAVSEEAQAAKENESPPLAVDTDGAFISRGEPGRIFIMASSEMLTDNVIDAQARGANALFIANVIDALNGREDMAQLRSKQQDFNPIQPIGAGTKTVLKTLNIAGLPILVVLFGLAVWFRRMSRKKRIQEMFQA